MQTVRTKEELKQAIKNDEDEIIVIGSLADNLQLAKKITRLTPKILGVLTAAATIGAATALPTGGLSLGLSSLALAPIAIETGLSVSTILFILAIGVGFLLTIYNDYDFEYDAKNNRVKLSKQNSHVNY